VPSNPNRTYKNAGWQGWGHWLGTGNLAPQARQFLPFPEALAVVWSLNLASSTEWKAWCKEGLCPINVPSHPDRTYKGDGWQGWGHWLGTGNQSNAAKKQQFLVFDEALRMARSLRLLNQREWKAWSRSSARPANMPSCPHLNYVHKGWVGYTHWLNDADPTAAAAPSSSSTRPASTRREPFHSTPIGYIVISLSLGSPHVRSMGFALHVWWA